MQESHRWNEQLPENIRWYWVTPGSPGEPTPSVGPGASTAPASLRIEAASLGRDHRLVPGLELSGAALPMESPVSCGICSFGLLSRERAEASSPGAVGHPGFCRDPIFSRSLRPSVRGRHQTQPSTGERLGTVLCPRHGQREGWVSGKPSPELQSFQSWGGSKSCPGFHPPAWGRRSLDPTGH
ncbi:hypothetical protein NDU88_002764 [Pleurodeles waltl]|uniref:Uncharacterized protein n=1 Tax=Pleurodeles waltl TaxID=8319 RepID=A0AAV7WQU7_PLEWA|nr:hypothetical protein NDU88_002764 [Pleurodeles waltl]